MSLQIYIYPSKDFDIETKGNIINIFTSYYNSSIDHHFTFLDRSGLVHLRTKKGKYRKTIMIEELDTNIREVRIMPINEYLNETFTLEDYLLYVICDCPKVYIIELDSKSCARIRNF